MSVIMAIFSSYGLPALIAVTLFWIIRQFIRRRVQGPPGPIGLPVVGYLPFMSQTARIHLVFSEMAKKYGDVFMIQLGEKEQLILNSDDAIREAFRRPDFNGRATDSMMFDALREVGEKNLLAANGERWRYSRNVAVRGLSLFAASRASRLGPSAAKVSEWFITVINDAEGKPIKTRPLLMQCTTAMMTSILFGTEPDPESPPMKRLAKIMIEFIAVAGAKFQFVEIFPTLRPFHGRFKKEMMEALESYVIPVKQQMAAHHFDGTVRTIGDAIKNAVKETPEAEKDAAQVTDEDIENIAIDLFDAGFFTISENLEWILLLSATYPEVMKKVQEEIDAMIPSDENLSVEIMKSMPYTKAVIYETLRWASSLSVTLPHVCTQKATFRNWEIDEGTQLIANQWSVNHNQEIFDDPEAFKPERFILADGSYDQHKTEKIMAFSVGKRRCPGEQLAIHETFLLYAYLLRRFNVYRNPEKEEKDPLTDGPPSFTNSPGPHTLIFKERSKH